MQTKLISAFPGTGKTYYYTNRPNVGLPILDSDSSTFDKAEFPKNYIKHIKENIGKASVIFISSHKEVRDALVREGLDFCLVFPKRESKQEYVDRYIERGSSEKFIELVESQWDNWLRELENQPNCTRIQLESNQFITDIINNKTI